MKMITCTVFAAALALTLPGCNQQEAAAGNEAAAEATAETADLTALNGTWKTDPASIKFEQKPDEILLQDGTYKCSTCIPPLTVAADGQFHDVTGRPYADSIVLQNGTYTCSTCIPPLTVAADGQFHDVTGRPYADSISIKVVDDKSVEWKSRKGGRDVFNATMSVSADGNTLTRKFTDSTTPNAPAVEGTSTATRAGPAPAGAHAISGQWTPDRVNEYSDEGLNVTFKIEGNKVTSTYQGQTYVAELGGPAVPVEGDIGGTTVTVAQEGNALKETFSREGKVVSEVVTTVSADGKSISWTSSDPRDGSKVSGTANKTS